MNRYTTMRRGRHDSRGAALVEMAIVVTLFLVLIFGIIEFARALFSWGVAVEATRAAARYAIVNTTVGNLPTCPGGADVTYSVNFDDCTCPQPSGGAESPLCGIVGSMCLARYALRTENAQVNVTYRCSNAGFSGAPRGLRPYEIEVGTSGFEHHFSAIWGLLGFGEYWEVPSFSTTRLTEDLETP